MGNTLCNEFNLDNLVNNHLINKKHINKNELTLNLSYILRDIFLRILRKLNIY